MRYCVGFLVVGLVSLAGCNQNSYGWPSQTSAWQQPSAAPQVAQMQDLTRRASELDVNNRDLHAQFAQAQQQVQLLRDETSTLRKQLSETTLQLQSERVAREERERQFQTLQASMRHRGGATITANNSVRQSLTMVDLPGMDVRQDGDVIRIAVPADQLFAAGTAQLLPAASQTLDRVADVITRSYSRQFIGVEGHTDSAPPAGGFASAHALATAQANAIFEQLTRRNRLPPNQLSVVAHGANYPLASNATQSGRAKNRRIEFVINPESFEQR